jgi:hypothetical protein
MSRCRHWQKRIPEAIYGELDLKTRESMERHLAACEGCAGLYHKMATAVRKMEARPAPDRPPEYWNAYWDRLEARMAHDATAARPRRAPAVRAWAYGTAGAILFLSLGIFIGRTFLRIRPELPPQAGTASTGAAPAGQPRLETGAGTAPLAVRASRYLKRSRVLLLAIVNSDPKDEDLLKLNLPLRKKASEELLLEAAALKKGLGSSDRRLERLIADLEMILLQIANLTPDSDETDIEIIKAGVEGRDILFKINLNETVHPKQKAGAGLSPAWPGENRDPSRIRTAPSA